MWPIVYWNDLSYDERYNLFCKRYPFDNWFYNIRQIDLGNYRIENLPEKLVKVFTELCNIM